MSLASEASNPFPPMRIIFKGALLRLELTHPEAEKWHSRKAKHGNELKADWHQEQAEANKDWTKPEEAKSPSLSRKIELWTHGYYR